MSDSDLSKALFSPDAVALIGASANLSKNSSRPQRYLDRHGFKGRVVPINPGRDEVQGAKAYQSVSDVPDGIDHAYLMIPAAAVPDAIDACVAKGVKVATIFSDGFAETGEQGAQVQREICEAAKAGGLRLLGPNSMGVIDTGSGLALSVNAVLEMEHLPRGNIGLISQSGTILGTLISRGAARGIGFSKLVSLGNESDLSAAEVCNLLIDDPETQTIVLFLEGIRDAAGLGQAARRAYAKGKPVIVYKLGRSEAGRQLAVSHSGAIAGPDRCIQAFFNHHGIIRVDMLENLFECPALVAGQRPVPGKRVAVVTTTGGGAATVADRLGGLGLELVGPPPSLRKRLQGLGLNLGGGPLVDLTMAGAKKEIYSAALDELLNNEDIDAVVAVVGSSGLFHSELAVSPIIEAFKAGKFLATFIAPQADESLSRLADAGIAAFRTPEACADAVYAALNWRAPVEVDPSSMNLRAVDQLLAGRMALNEQASGEVFHALGIQQAGSRIIVDPETDDLSGIIYPVVAKVLSPEIAHKSDVGGVCLGIGNSDELKAACAGIAHAVQKNAPDAKVNGYLVQTMEQGLADVLIGYRVDAEVGPVVVLGAGGILAEIYDDVAIRPAPIDRAVAMEMIEDVKGLAIIRGYRSSPPGDLDALADAMVAISNLVGVETNHVLEAEINPLIVKRRGEGVVAVDGLIVCAEETT